MNDNIKTWPERIDFPTTDLKIITRYGADAWVQCTVEYIRSDIAKAREAKLLEALKDARAEIDIYAPHASDYLQTKYQLKNVLSELDAIIAEFEVPE